MFAFSGIFKDYRVKTVNERFYCESTAILSKKVVFERMIECYNLFVTAPTLVTGKGFGHEDTHIFFDRRRGRCSLPHHLQMVRRRP